MNSAARITAFTFGCVIVATLNNTILVLSHVHLRKISLDQMKRRRVISNFALVLLVALFVTFDVMLYIFDSWTEQYGFTSSATLWGVLSLVHVSVVYRLFKILN